jgi:uncharacterized protein YjbJ (UPF0337 family)
MEWNAIEASWEKVAAAMKVKWSGLTDDDLRFVDKNKDAMIAKVRSRTGLENNTVERQLDWLIAGLAPSQAEKPAPRNAPPAAATPPVPDQA